MFKNPGSIRPPNNVESPSWILWQQWRRSRGNGGIYPLQYLTRGDCLCNHPPSILWKVNNILPYLYKYSDKINRFCSKNGWFFFYFSKILSKISPKMQNFGQSDPKKCVFYPSPALNLSLKVFTKLHDFSCKDTKFSCFWGGHILPQTPPVCAIGANMPPNHPPNVEDGSSPLYDSIT